MELAPALNLAGAAITAGLGLAALLNPDWAARFTGIRPEGRIGRSEIRATYGGFFLALGILALAMRDPPVLVAVGLAWLGAAGARVLSIAVDRSREPRNVGAVLFEAAIGLMLLAR